MNPNLKLVFVYLGNEIPKYFALNVNRTAELFDYEVILVLDTKSSWPRDTPINSSIRLVVLESYNDDYLQFLNHDMGFRQGFWFFTIKRLLVLKEVHEQLGRDCPILHVEGDMLLFPSFPFTEVLFDKLKWFGNNKVSDVGSLVYSPNLMQTEWLHSQIILEIELDTQVTDMSALKRVRAKNPSRIEIFNDLFSENYHLHETNLFDGANLGVWLCGVDPRNTYGFHFIHENGEVANEKSLNLGSILSTAHLTFDHKQVYLAKGNSVKKNLHCLHIHSKDIDLFNDKSEQVLKKYIDWAHYKSPMVVGFDPKLFFSLIKSNFRNRSLKNYLRNFFSFLLKGEEISELRIFSLAKWIFSRTRRP